MYELEIYGPLAGGIVPAMFCKKSVKKSELKAGDRVGFMGSRGRIGHYRSLCGINCCFVTFDDAKIFIPLSQWGIMKEYMEAGKYKIGIIIERKG